jgi:hypothetical protein
MDATHLALLLVAIGVVAFLLLLGWPCGRLRLHRLARARPSDGSADRAPSLTFWSPRSARFNFGRPVISAGDYFGPSSCSQSRLLILAVTCNCGHNIKNLIGLVLLFSAVPLFFRRGDPQEVEPPSPSAAISLGGIIGLLSGLTGTGGGIFLTPAPLFFRWARNPPSGCRFGGLHPRQFDRRSGWVFHREPVFAFPRSDSRRGSGNRRRTRFSFRQSPISSAHDFVSPGDRAHHRGNEAHLDPLNWRDGRRPVRDSNGDGTAVIPPPQSLHLRRAESPGRSRASTDSSGDLKPESHPPDGEAGEGTLRHQIDVASVRKARDFFLPIETIAPPGATVVRPSGGSGAHAAFADAQSHPPPGSIP